MRRASRLVVGLGVLLVILAGVWRLVVPGLAVRLPSDLDKTVHATGTFTLYANGATRSPLSRPRTSPLDSERRVHVVSSTSERAVVAETDVEAIQGLPKQTFRQQYVLDRKNSRNVGGEAAGGQSWAYTPSTKVDRSPYWSVNLPFNTGSGPYEIWKNEIGAGYPCVGAGKVTVGGVGMQRLQGHISNAAVADYYVQQLGSLLPSTITAQQIDPLFRPRLYNRTAILTRIAPLLSAADAAQVIQLENAGTALHYRLDVATTLLVEPRTGAITDLAKIDQTMYAVPDLAGVRTLQQIFSRPAYASNVLVAATGEVMKNILADPPRLKIFNVTYSQTPASVADITSYAKKKGDQIELVSKTFPLALLLTGVAVIAIGLLMAAAAASGSEPPPGSRARARPPGSPVPPRVSRH